MRAPLDIRMTPGEMLRAVRHERAPFALVGRWAGVRAIVGCNPARLEVDPADPFALLDALPEPAGDARIGGGWFGYLGFPLAARLERLDPAPPRPQALPASVLGLYERVLVLDDEGRWWSESLAGQPAPPPPAGVAGAWRVSGMVPRAPGLAGHATAVAECVERIAAGEIFQANLCLRLEGTLEGDPLDVFADTCERLQPPFGACFAGAWGAVISFSPELFLRRNGDHVLTAPIKGTVPRPAEPAAAGAARDELAASAKDAAENVMIVDLMRNDLGRVARYGSVRAAPRPALEAHPGVWHLVSHVEAELRPGTRHSELLRAAFPPGSVTGAPKVQSLKVIAALEATQREAYTGAIGFASPHAGLELSVAIRTFEARDGAIWLGCGGGVTAGSTPEGEVAEALDKARPLVDALGGRLTSAPSRTPRVPPFAAAPRPDPGAGLLETIAVRDGEPVAVEAHLRRLAASARAVFGVEPPADLHARVRASAEGAGRVRIVLAPDGRAEVAPGPPAHPGLPELVPVCLPGGLGAHKWADRRFVEAFSPATPLIVDADGTVLEAGFANVWIELDGVLVTPPADGRILPGITRARLLSTPGHAERAFTLAELEAAPAVHLSSALRGLAPLHVAAYSGA